MRSTTLDTGGVAPDVVWVDEQTIRVAYGALDERLLVLTVDAATLATQAAEQIYAGLNGGDAFPRVDEGGWLIYRGPGPDNHAFLRQDGFLPIDLGLCWGNAPVALGHGYWAIQRTDESVVRGPLSVSASLGVVVRQGASTGLSRILADGTVKLVDEDRGAVAGTTIPDWTADGSVSASEGANLGASLTDGQRELVIWPGQETREPRIAASPSGRLAVVTWGQPGVRLAIVERSEMTVIVPKPAMPQPDVAFHLEGNVGIITSKANVATLRWHVNGSNAPTPNDRDTYDFSCLAPSTYAISVLALGVDADADHLAGSGGKQVVFGPQALTVSAPLPVSRPVGSRGLCAGEADPYDPAWLANVKGHGYEVQRPDAQRATPDQIAEWDRRLLAAGLMPFYLCIASQFPIMPIGSHVEPRHALDTSTEGAEPNLTTGAAAYAAIINQWMPEARKRGLHVWAGMSNINVADRAWVTQLVAHLDPDVGISLHPYAISDGCRTGWLDRSDLLDPILALIRPRLWVVGEQGRSQGIQIEVLPHGFWQNLLKAFGQWHEHTHLTDAELTRMADQDAAWFQAKGAQVACRYQIHDGLERCPQHPTMAGNRLAGYGAQRLDGSWKG